MIPELMYRWMARRAHSQPIAERMVNNMRQFMPDVSEEHCYPWFGASYYQQLKQMMTYRFLAPQRWSQKLSVEARTAIEVSAVTHGLYKQRLLLPLLRWHHLPLVLAYLIEQAPTEMEVLFLTRDTFYQRLNQLRPARKNGLFGQRPLIIVLFIDERLSDAHLQPYHWQRNRFLLSTISADVMQRLNLQLCMLLPTGNPMQGAFAVTTEISNPDALNQLYASTFRHLSHHPEQWAQWDHFSQLLHR